MKISIIGAGNMAHQLGKALHDAGHDIVEIYNRSYRKGTALAQQLAAKSVKQIDELDTEIDLLIVAVSDDAIGQISSKISSKKYAEVIVVHTSGSVPSTVLKKHDLHGVFYPFQSMTAGQDLDFKSVPVLVHSHDEKCLMLLTELADTISDNVHAVSDDQRGVIHIAGVFANNFSNHMMALADGILNKNQLPSSVIKPLITNTLQKILEMDAKSAQTGPAIRRDEAIMEKHLDYLSDQPKLMALYKMVSESIIELDDSSESDRT